MEEQTKKRPQIQHVEFIERENREFDTVILDGQIITGVRHSELGGYCGGWTRLTLEIALAPNVTIDLLNREKLF